MAATADIIVIGLGAVGSSAIYQAAKMKARVIGIDRFAPPHDQGSSHGDTRITRQAIGEGREFVPLVLRSNQIWEELEASTGRSLMTRCGCLVLASPNVPGQHHGSRSFLQDTIDAASEFGIAHEALNAAELRRRYPQFRLHGDEVGYFEAGAGFLRPEECMEAQLDLARRSAAQVFLNEVVTEIVPSGNTVQVRTNRETYSAAHVIITAGAWIPKLLGEDYSKVFRIHRQMICWFAIAANANSFAPEHFPVFIWITGNQPRDMMYGFPAIDGARGGVKIATEQYENTVDPDCVPRDVAASEIAALYNEYLALRFPDVSPECLRSATCLYTVTPDAKFVIDRFRDCDNVWFASACSGHGFKHSAAIGEALARQALAAPPLVDLSMFGVARFEKLQPCCRLKPTLSSE
jgi:sarcosine oxidase